MTTWTLAERWCSASMAETRGLLGLADRYVDGRDGGDVEEGADRVHQDGEALELEKLLGNARVGVGHAGADSGGGDDHEDRHGNVSIPLNCRGWGIGGVGRGLGESGANEPRRVGLVCAIKFRALRRRLRLRPGPVRRDRRLRRSRR